jgi:hypothetical protein
MGRNWPIQRPGFRPTPIEWAGLRRGPLKPAHPPPPGFRLAVASGGNNVPDRFSSDLWVHGGHAYTGTWGNRNGSQGNVLKVWSLGASGGPTLVGSVTTADIGTVSDVEVSSNGRLLIFSGERGVDGGIYLYGLNDPANPSFLGSASVGPAGVHTVTLATINGRLYAFAARNTGGDPPALLIYDVTYPYFPVLVETQPVPGDFGARGCGRWRARP